MLNLEPFSGQVDASTKRLGRDDVLGILKASAKRLLHNDQIAFEMICSAISDSATLHLGSGAVRLKYVHELAVTFTRLTGEMPGFSNSENETRFERFVYGLSAIAHVQIKRSQIKGAIRQLDAKRNPVFLKIVGDIDAASVNRI